MIALHHQRVIDFAALCRETKSTLMDRFIARLGCGFLCHWNIPNISR
jgi:hypothetical protein